jgi:hypothetical protein
VAQFGAAIAWPFAGRIFRAIGDDRVDRTGVCRRTSAGLRFQLFSPHDLLDELSQAPIALLEQCRVPAALRDALGALLGYATAPRLTARSIMSSAAPTIPPP